jgi:phosphatidylglycerophosphatase C
VSTVVAAFDVDGTLTVHDCVVPFLRRTCGTSRLVVRLLRHPLALVGPLARRDRDGLKAAAAAAAFEGLALEPLRAAGVEFGNQVARGWLRGDTASRLRWHLDQGHLVVLVSASFEIYLDALGERLGVDAVLATRLEVGADGHCTGRLEGANCRGTEKVRRLHAWLDAAHGGRSAVTIWAYGDSPGDQELLDDADHGVWATRPLTSVAAFHV